MHTPLLYVFMNVLLSKNQDTIFWIDLKNENSPGWICEKRGSSIASKGFDLTKIHLHFRWKAKAYIVNDGIWARLSNGYFMPYVRSLGTSRATHRARACMSLPYFFCQEAGKVAKWTNPFFAYIALCIYRETAATDTGFMDRNHESEYWVMPEIVRHIRRITNFMW